MISALYENVMSDLGVQERRGRAGPGYQTRRLSQCQAPASTTTLDTNKQHNSIGGTFLYPIILVFVAYILFEIVKNCRKA